MQITLNTPYIPPEEPISTLEVEKAWIDLDSELNIIYITVEYSIGDKTGTLNVSIAEDLKLSEIKSFVEEELKKVKYE